MAGVNLSEESACILAANSEAVGTLIRSCSEELLLFSDALEKKILEIGEICQHVAYTFNLPTLPEPSLLLLGTEQQNLFGVKQST